MKSKGSSRHGATSELKIMLINLKFHQHKLRESNNQWVHELKIMSALASILCQYDFGLSAQKPIPYWKRDCQQLIVV